MAAVYLYGASDDLIEVEGSVPGCDEYNAEDEHFLLIGPSGKVRARVWYTKRGVWAIAVAPVAEDVPMLPVGFEPVQSGYSARACVQGVEMVIHERSPRFEHDCDKCVFLGQQGEEDVYFCTQGGAMPTVIFRWGDDGPEYLSGWHLRGKLDGPLRARLEEVSMPDSPLSLSACSIWRVETWKGDEAIHDIRGYYSSLTDANGAANHYRESEGGNSAITTLDLSDSIERDDLCSRLNRGLK